MKTAISTTPVRKTSDAAAEAIINKATKAHGKDVPKESKAGKQSKIDKQAGKGVGRDWSALGYKVAVRVKTADSEAEQVRCEALTEMEVFAPMGFAPASGNGKAKKREFTPQTETFFKGWKKLQDELDAKAGKSFQTRISEARRVCHAYILAYDGGYPGIDVKGSAAVAQVTAYLTDKATGYHAKIQGLPVMQLAPRAAATPRNGSSRNENHVEALSKAEKTQRTQIVAKFTPEEIGAIFNDLPESLLIPACSALAVRLQVTKDPQVSQIGKTIRALLDSIKRTEDAADIKDATSKAAAGEQSKAA